MTPLEQRESTLPLPPKKAAAVPKKVRKRQGTTHEEVASLLSNPPQQDTNATAPAEPTEKELQELEAEVALLAKSNVPLLSHRFLTKEEEITLTNDIVKKRQQWREAMYAHPFGQQLATIHKERNDTAEIKKLDNLQLKRIMEEMKDLCLIFRKYEEHWNTPQNCPKLVEMMKETGLEPKQFAEELRQIQEYHAQWQNVRHKLVLANKALVVNCAKPYRNRGLPFAELCAEGSLGLLAAVDKFKPQLENRFSTYAVWWIRRYLQTGTAEKTRLIRIPSHQRETISVIHAFIEKHRKENNGQMPSYEVMSQHLNIPQKRITDILCASKPSKSIYTPGSDEQEENTALLQDRREISVTESLDRQDQFKAIVEALGSLNANERKVLILRFRLGLVELPQTPEEPGLRFAFDEEMYRKEYTLKEVGEMMNLTRERVRQIQNKALEKLRKTTAHPFRHLLAELDEREPYLQK